MICLIASTYRIANKFADTQNLHSSEWFYLSDEIDIRSRTNFHVIVVGEIEPEKLHWFEKVYSLAKVRGNIGRNI